jgi:membrane protein required for colicin V production
LNIADLIILLVVVVSVIQAAVSGFFQEAFAIAGLVFGYLVAAWQYRSLGDYIGRYVSSRWLVDIVAFLAILLGVMLVAGILGRITRWIIRGAGLNVLDRFLGALLGLARGCLFVAVVLLSMTAFAPTSRWLQGSALAPYFLVVGRAAIWVAPSQLRAQFYQGLDYLRRGQNPEASHKIRH